MSLHVSQADDLGKVDVSAARHLQAPDDGNRQSGECNVSEHVGGYKFIGIY